MSFSVYALSLKNIERERRNQRRLTALANLGISRNNRSTLPAEQYDALLISIRRNCTTNLLDILFQEADNTEAIDEDYKNNVIHFFKKVLWWIFFKNCFVNCFKIYVIS
jgi:hypothetical protein